MRPIALIPARGGSKRIPRKNIKPFCGRPIIAYTIECARESGLFGAIIVSTDDAEIAQVARDFGASTPFVRPDSLSDDHATTTAVIHHAITTLGVEEETLLCCLYPTAPLLETASLIQGFRALEENRSKRYAFSATAYTFPPQRSFKITPDGPQMLFPEHLATRSQDLEPIYHDAGQFYWARASTWKASEAIFAAHSVPILLDPLRVQDIDTMEDWHLAELKYHLLHS